MFSFEKSKFILELHDYDDGVLYNKIINVNSNEIINLKK